MTIHRLVYHSSNRIRGTDAAVEGEIEAILAASRRNNDLVGVTGALMFNSGFFVQVLEGDQRAVEATFERIQQDERHGDVTLLEFVPAAIRAFGNWSMAFVGARAAETERYGSIAERSGFDPRALSGNQLFVRLNELMLAESRTAG